MYKRQHIFLIPANSKADVLLIDFFNKISEVFTNQEEIDNILDNSMVVLVGRTPKMSGKEATIAMKSLAAKSAKAVGIEEDRAMVIPFDRAFVEPPLKWGRVSFATKHMLRGICANIVEDAIGKE